MIDGIDAGRRIDADPPLPIGDGRGRGRAPVDSTDPGSSADGRPVVGP